jgi:hypothetical protein
MNPATWVVRILAAVGARCVYWVRIVWTDHPTAAVGLPALYLAMMAVEVTIRCR